MGTSVTKEWATASHGWHKRNKILSNHSNKFLKIYKRFIDDIFGLWLDPNLSEGLTTLQEESY